MRIYRTACQLISVFIMLMFLSCNSNPQKTTEQNGIAKNDSSAAEEKTQIVKKVADAEPLAVDTGQTWFKVAVTRNDSAFINYEGTWPVLLTTDGFATLALTASKGALVISHGVTFYIYGWPQTDRVPIKSNASTKGEISMILVPEENKRYGLSISADTGFVEFTRNDGKVMSGYFEAQTKNDNNKVYRFRGQFLNVRPR